MKDKIGKVIISVCAVLMTGCSTVPITGRKQLKIIPEQQMIAQSAVSYAEVISEGPLSTNKEQTEQIQRVGERIAAAVEAYLAANNQLDLIDGFDWQFNLIDDDVPNAWCMPGGKVVFYTGILPYTKDENGIAVVMGHEIAHAIAGHGTERVSHQMIQQGGGVLAAYFSKDSDYHEAVMMAYGLGSQYGVMLPYSRGHESEADHMGLIFMAMAGYNPEDAVEFWQRMGAAGGDKPPEFLSTHPSDQTRVRELREHMPEALEYYTPQ
ncbi:M48 family metallopeptidase [Pontiellaceae bacterium B1224]|nr:M48 family metallopeptidase [Pontiellaceae bacterium B1224]